MVMHLLKKKYYPIKMVSSYYMMEMMVDFLKNTVAFIPDAEGGPDYFNMD